MKTKYFFAIIIWVSAAFFQVQKTSAAFTPGTCTGDSSKIVGICRPTGECLSTEKADSTCTAASGKAADGTPYLYMDCCVVSSVAAAAGVSSATASGEATKFTNPLAFSTVEDLLGNVMGAVQKIIVTLALLAIIIGALMYVTSAGNTKQIEKAREAISAALIGLALAIAAPSLLKELSALLGWTPNNANVSSSLSLSAIAINVLNFLLGVFGILALIMMIIGAGLYLTSAGDTDRIDKGKDIFKYSVIGVVVAMSAMILLRQIAAFFMVA